ncbi:MAG: hypothetical protein WBG70_17230 [Spirulinaceae cyanobacterium]
MSENEAPENRHSVTDKKYCYKMSRKYQWTLLRVESNGSRDLPYDCIFKGKQTSFEDKTYD